MTGTWSAIQIATCRRIDMMRTAARQQLARTATQRDARGNLRTWLSTLVTALVPRFASAQPTASATAWRDLHDDA